MTFQHGSPAWRFHSDPETHHNSITGEQIEGLYREGRNKFREVDDSFASELFLKAADSAHAAINEERKRRKRPKKRKSDDGGGAVLIAPEKTAPKGKEREPHKVEDEFKDIELLDYNPKNHERREVLKRTSQVLSVFFGLTLVLVGEGGAA